MRKILKLLSLAAVFALAACSSLEPADDFERYGNFLPPDFNLAKFSELNPDIAALQATDTIRQINLAWEAKQTEDNLDVGALKEQDNGKFVYADGINIAKNYLKWNDAEMDKARVGSKADTAALGRWLRFNILGSDNELDFLENFLQTKADSTLILQTFVKYSLRDGRPYRVCKDSEAGNEQKSEKMDGVIERKAGSTTYYDYSNLFFCDNNGKVLKVTDF